MGLNLLIKLSENDKRIIIALCLAIIIVFVLIGLLGSLVIRTMKWQGKKCDELINEVVINRIVTTPKELKSYARKKNSRCFIKQAWIPIVLIATGVLLLIIHNAAFNNWSYNPFSTGDGFGSLFFVWDFGDANSYHSFFGIKLLYKWPPLINSPHFETKAIFAYIAIPCMIVGAVWYFVAAQAYLARTIRAHKLARTVFDKSLDNYNQNTPIQNTPIQEVNTGSDTEQ